MSNDATEWLGAHRPSRSVEDPCRGESLLERIEPGDVFDDGSILTDKGVHLMTGAIWLTELKARAAAYYGWHLAGPETGWCIKLEQRLFPMRR